MRLDLRKLGLDKRKLYEIARIGLPAGLQGMVFSISNVVIQSSVNSFGSTIMSGNGAASNIEGFVYVAMNAFYQAAITFTSQNMGAAKTKRVTKVLFITEGLVIITGIILGNGASMAGHTLLSIYSTDEAVIAAGQIRLNYICSWYALCGMMDVMVGMLRGIGYSVAPMIVSLVGACGLRLVWIATYFAAHRSIDVLYFSYPLSWLITFLVQLFVWILVYKKAYRTVEPDEVEA